LKIRGRIGVFHQLKTAMSVAWQGDVMHCEIERLGVMVLERQLARRRGPRFGPNAWLRPRPRPRGTAKSRRRARGWGVA